MRTEKVKGLIIKTTDVGEANKLLTLLTPSGKVQAYAAGVRSIKSKRHAACQLLCYGEYVLSEGKSGLAVMESELLENFYAIREDVMKLALAAYFLELTSFAAEGEAVPELLSWLLNTLYVLSRFNPNPALLKNIYELHLMCLLGYRPDAESCVACGEEAEGKALFSSAEGGILCQSCESEAEVSGMIVDKETRHFLAKMVSLSPKELLLLCNEQHPPSDIAKICSDFLQFHLGFSFKTEQYLRKFGILP